MDDAKKESLSQKMSEYDFIRFCVCDIAGISKSKVIPARNASDYIEKGPVAWTALVAMGTHGGCPVFLKECAEGHHGNCVLMPQPETLHEVPWAGEQRHSVASILCETSWVSGVPQDACPRYVARKQLKELEKMGFTLLSGFEHEFILFKEGTKKPAHSRNDFMTTSTAARHESFLFDLDDALSKIGINVATLQTEYSEGQLEVTCKPKFGIQTADETFIFREAVKEIAHQKGFDANFMSKPSPDLGNGTHFNLSLWDLKGEKNVFYDSADKDKLSDICKFFIGGLIKHAAAITAIASPTVNCYRRIHSEWAAHLKDWGIEDRLGSFRVKNYSPKVTLIENRTAGGACNPYLTTAVTIAAGIDGIKNKIDPPKMYERDAPRLPESLEEALIELEKDTAIVDALGEEFIRWYVQPKREFELKTLKGFDPKVFNEEWQDKEWEEFKTI